MQMDSRNGSIATICYNNKNIFLKEILGDVDGWMESDAPNYLNFSFHFFLSKKTFQLLGNADRWN